VACDFSLCLITFVFSDLEEKYLYTILGSSSGVCAGINVTVAFNSVMYGEATAVTAVNIMEYGGILMRLIILLRGCMA
jgi:hypothetical protein